MPPPFQTSHGPKAFVANKVFTDREKPLRLFEDALISPPALDAYRVLTFYGVGGEGKTALGAEFARFLKRNFAGHAGWAKINFEDARLRAADEGLLALRLQLRESADVQFPAFDTAFVRLFALRRPGADIRGAHPELFRSGSEVIEDILSLGGGIVPGLDLVYKYFNRSRWPIQEWWQRRGKEVLAGLDALDGDRLLAKLPVYFGADLCDALATVPRRKPFVIVGDTYEAFHRGQGFKTGPGAFHNDGWLRDLIRETPGVLFVLLGRDRLRWSEVEADWGEVLDQHRLGALSDEDAQEFLVKAGVAEPNIRGRIVEGAEGLPFYLDLQVDLYQDLRNAGGTLDVGRFGGSQLKIIAKFLDHLGQEAERLLVVLAHAQRFDEPLFLHLARTFCGGLPLFGFGDVKAFSFTEELGDDTRTLHALMREALTVRMQTNEPCLSSEIHAALFEWWDARCQPLDQRSITTAHELALREAAFHLAEHKPESFRSWLTQRWEVFYEGARYALVKDLWSQTAAIAETTHGFDSLEVGKVLGNLSSVFWKVGQLAEARSIKERVAKIFIAELGSDHPEVAKNFNNLGAVLRAQGKIELACRMQARALTINVKHYGPNHHEVMNNLMNIGLALEDLGEHVAARRAHIRALKISKKMQNLNHTNVAKALNNLGRALRGLGRLSASFRLLKISLKIKERSYDHNHPDIANTLNNLGDVLSDLGEHAAAREMWKRALSIYTAAYGPDHPNTRIVSASLERNKAADGDDIPR